MQLPPETKGFITKVAIVYLCFPIVFAIAHWCLVSPEQDFSSFDWTINLFNLRKEGNLPAWYASIVWFSVAVWAMFAFMVEKYTACTMRWRFGWILIALVFIIASADEIIEIHEHLEAALKEQLSSHPIGIDPQYYLSYLPFLLPFAAVLIIVSLFLHSRIVSSRSIVVFFVIAIISYTIALSCDLYQGVFNFALLSAAEQIGTTEGLFTKVTVIIEETLETMGTTMIALGIAAYTHSTAYYYLQHLTNVPDVKSPEKD